MNGRPSTVPASAVVGSGGSGAVLGGEADDEADALAIGVVGSLDVVGDTLTIAAGDAMDAALDGHGVVGSGGVAGGGSFAAHAQNSIRACIAFYGQTPHEERIAAIRCPVLAFYGEKDEQLVQALPALKDSMKHVTDARPSEMLPLVSLLALIVLVGVAPSVLTNVVAPSVTELMKIL